MRYADLSPEKSDCSCCVGRFTYCDGRMMPRKLCCTVIHAPIPERRALAFFSSSASSEGARLHSTRSTPDLSPMVEYANVVTVDPAVTTPQKSSALRQRCSRSSLRHAG